MNKLKEISEMNIKITWKFIEIGYAGYDFIEKQLNKEEICEYAYNLLQDMKDNFEDITELVSVKDDEYEFKENLMKLSKKENSNFDLQIKKWIVYLADDMLLKLKNNYLEDLLDISDFWVSLGQPENSPHIFQGVENIIMPKEYYTEKTYNLIINKHREWIHNEKQKIIEMER